MESAKVAQFFPHTFGTPLTLWTYRDFHKFKLMYGHTNKILMYKYRGKSGRNHLVSPQLEASG